MGIIIIYIYLHVTIYLQCKLGKYSTTTATPQDMGELSNP